MTDIYSGGGPLLDAQPDGYGFHRTVGDVWASVVCWGGGGAQHNSSFFLALTDAHIYFSRNIYFQPAHMRIDTTDTQHKSRYHAKC